MRALQVLLAATIVFPFPEYAIASRPPRAAGTSSDLFEEVSKLFQNGDERVDVDQAKALLTACAEAAKQNPPGTDLSEDFYKSADQFVSYIDNHRLEAADIVTLREWIASSFECGDDGRKGVVNAIGNSISWALLRIIESVSRGDGGYEPRHAIVCDVLSQPGISLPCLSSRVLMNHRKSIGKRVPEDYLFGGLTRSSWPRRAERCGTPCFQHARRSTARARGMITSQ